MVCDDDSIMTVLGCAAAVAKYSDKVSSMGEIYPYHMPSSVLVRVGSKVAQASVASL
jgi:hypothetical protein